MKNRKTGYNSGFASGGVTCKLGALCFYSSAVLVDSFVLRNPPERKAPNRYSQAWNEKNVCSMLFKHTQKDNMKSSIPKVELTF